MTNYTFDRQLLAKIETTEGTAIAADATNYIDTLTDIEVEINPVSQERDLVRPGFTMVPDLYASSGIGASEPVGTGTISFSVEMSLKSGSTPVTTEPQWGALLKSCGFALLENIKRIGTGGTITSGPLLNRENLLVSAATVGQLLGTTFTGDTYAYYVDDGGISASDAVSGDVSAASFTASGVEADVGLGYALSTEAGNGDGSSCSIYLWRAGRTWSFKGCRGNVSFTFNSTDRVIMAFTMQGVLHSIVNGSKLTGIGISHGLPSTFDDATLKINEHGAEATAFTGANFETMTLDMGNQVAMRLDANSAAGYKAAIINGREPRLNMTLDSVVGGTTSSTVFDFAKQRALGNPIRTEWKVGAGMDAASALFRAPCAQVMDLGFTDRDTIDADEVEFKLSGGLIGDSVVAASGDARYYDDRGVDNELTIVLF